MKNTLKISLKAGEKIYVNGAVIKVDRKCQLEFLNDVQFLLQNHVLQPEEAVTPLRQLYFVVQVMLMNPESREQTMGLYRTTMNNLLSAFRNEQILAGLKHVDEMVVEAQVYDALKAIRQLYPLEEEIVGKPASSPVTEFKKAVGA
ncbi:flagellar biosynthesis repressor FlbT [Nitratireductor basaltis]|uniref:Probable flagellum biosynthesis repressor protein FlbT n=1 Tax=Nitratireductor basaltis TaxID=472175 RepID=A0A084U886_9HYPH|nr:flagellar biosynthesis repressor FlbT [Nitratireductor basaltis]KFB09172.1 putative flagellum biosynthesis repressor protein FlbT [Nitratireductor basaltis]